MSKKFIELSKAQIDVNRNIVTSKNVIDGGYTVAQQVMIDEPRTSLFLKGAIHISTLEGLYNLKDAIVEAIEAEETEINEIL